MSATTRLSSTASIFSPPSTTRSTSISFTSRNWFQIPNSYDEPNQDQRQKVVSFNIAPGYQHTFGTSTLFTINPWVRRDFVNYYPSRDPFDDTPATLSQDRHLLNYGVRADISSVLGAHNLKVGTEIKQTRLFEDFFLGITDSTFNPDLRGRQWRFRRAAHGDQSGRLRGPGAHRQSESGARPGSVRPDARRQPFPFPRYRQSQRVRLLRPGFVHRGHDSPSTTACASTSTTA
jgi:hypothetical protein